MSQSGRGRGYRGSNTGQRGPQRGGPGRGPGGDRGGSENSTGTQQPGGPPGAPLSGRLPDRSRGGNFQGSGGNFQGRRGNFQGRSGNFQGSGGYRGGGGAASGTSQPIVPPGIYQADLSRPDPSITDLENALVKLTCGQTLHGMPGRRSYGTRGKEIVLRTNYFKIHPNSDADKQDPVLYVYEAALHPDGSKRKKQRAFEQITSGAPHFDDAGFSWATDYSSMIITTKKLDLGLNQVFESQTMQLPPEPDTKINPDAIQSSGTAPTFRYKLKLKQTLSLQHATEYLRSESINGAYADINDLIQTLNLVVTKRPHADADVTNTGKNTFFPFRDKPQNPEIENRDLGGGLHALRGYFASVRPSIGRLLTNINVCSGAFFKAQPVEDALRQAKLGSLVKEASFLRRVRVKVSYIKTGSTEPFMIKMRVIRGFALTNSVNRVKFGDATEVQFNLTDNSVSPNSQRLITVQNYFKEVHGIELQSPKLPVLNVGTEENPQYIPQEMARIEPGQAYRNFLSGDQTTAMLHFAARAPNQNAVSIVGNQSNAAEGQKLFGLVNNPGDVSPQGESLHPFGFRVDTNMLTVPGRILSAPQIEYKGGEKLSPLKGSWNFARQKFVTAVGFTAWQVLIIKHQRPGDITVMDNLAEAIDEFRRYLTGVGIVMGPPRRPLEISLDPLRPGNRTSNDSRLRGAFESARSAGSKFLFVLLPEADKWLYARIKFHGDVKYGIHTVNAIGSKFSKRSQPFYGNLSLKVNIKASGVSHIVPGTLGQSGLGENTMLVGIDVTHPSPGSAKNAPSIACVVASTDKNLFHWPGSIRVQQGKEEMVAELEMMVSERLKLWLKKNRRLPENVVVYRDGVSEGQYETVLQKEVLAFHQAFAKHYGGKPKWPKMAVIICGKRHHTRFYPTSLADADTHPKDANKGSFNPLPGTVVDRGIVGRNLHEFYLQAHQGLQGTARSAHYVVIHSTLTLNADQVEALTHKLCYHFCRASKAVSLCPPAYYADLLAERGRAYLYGILAENNDGEAVDMTNLPWNGEIHEAIKDSTWYI